MNEDEDEGPRESPIETLTPKLNGVVLTLERYASGDVVLHYRKGPRATTSYLLGIIDDPEERARLAAFLLRS